MLTLKRGFFISSPGIRIFIQEIHLESPLYQTDPILIITGEGSFIAPSFVSVLLSDAAQHLQTYKHSILGSYKIKKITYKDSII